MASAATAAGQASNAMPRRPAACHSGRSRTATAIAKNAISGYV